jgi:uncharacterized protein
MFRYAFRTEFPRVVFRRELGRAVGRLRLDETGGTFMKFFITGANGFVGTNLATALIKEGHRVTALVRDERRAGALPAGVALVVGDSTRPGSWQESVADHDVLINLAGASIFKRWNPEYKELLRSTRMLTTRNLVDALPDAGARVTLLSTSAVGYYGFTGIEELSEAESPGTDFLATLAKDWEAEALKARDKGARVVLMRFGVVLGSNGGALEQMVRPFRFFVGGPLGSGEQWFSWIHIEDLCRAVLFLSYNSEIRGPINFTAPQAVTNSDLAKAIGRALHRPAFMPAPGFMISLILGEFGSVILKGQRVVPRVLVSRGFSFKYPEIEMALWNLLRNTGSPPKG